MKKLIFLLLVLVSTGCVRYTADGRMRTAIMLQVGVVVRVVNNCAPMLDLERVNGPAVTGLAYGQSTTIPLVSTPFTGSNRRMPLTVKGFTLKNEYLGSDTREFYVNTHEGTREEVWEINHLRLPN